MIRRRDFVPIAGLGAVAGYAALHKSSDPVRPALGKSPVAVLKAANYQADLADLIYRGIQSCGLDVRGKNVLLKPNLVEFDHLTAINTDARMVAAAVEVFERMGAASVTIGEGPGHRRDTWDLASEAEYRALIPQFDRRFTDLNRDDVSFEPTAFDGSGLWVPNTVSRADLIVSLAKMKTHHWAGATLSMKNFFGVVPGSVYGWPKNHLHYFGIDESIIALNTLFGPRSFAIVDGVVGMEGNGPVQGTPKAAGVIVLGRDVAAVDATCCRIMGIDPMKLSYLSRFMYGNVQSESIEQRGEPLVDVKTDFALLKAFHHIRHT